MRAAKVMRMSRSQGLITTPLAAIAASICLTAAAATMGAVVTGDAMRQPAGTFAADVAFLQQHTKAIVLGTAPGPQVVVAPSYQGRVMTSTAGGADAAGFGWIGREAVASGKRQPHMNVFGGEDRLWLGPEGGQYALYFPPGLPFEFEHWQVPEAFDWGAWDAEVHPADVRVRKRMTLTNYARATFEIEVARTVRLLDSREAVGRLGLTPANGVRMVAFESSNTVVNAGRAAWDKSSGLVSIWILGQFNPSPGTTIVIPYQPGAPAARGPIVNDAYFGKVPADRLVVGPRTIFFKGDGQYRSKIGLPPARAGSIAGSYDASTRALTLVQYTRPDKATEYVNSMWEQQREPYKGDVINSYNDGPPAPGQKPLGPFYEVETSSPALALAPGQRYTHVHRTFHLVGAEAELDRVARATLGVSLAEVTGAFTK
jgi:hypothetical protein